MAKSLDVVAAMEQAKHIIAASQHSIYFTGQINLAGQILVAGELHRLTMAVEKLDANLLLAAGFD